MKAAGDGWDVDWLLGFAAWLLATVGTLGSLFFSDIMGFAPCTLCWWQRVCLYPLVLVLLAGLFPFDPRMVRYGLPLAACGWAVAAYHTLLYEGVIPESAAPCSRGVSCTEEYVELLGFLSIPALSLLCYTAIVALLVMVWRRARS